MSTEKKWFSLRWNWVEKKNQPMNYTWEELYNSFWQWRTHLNYKLCDFTYPRMEDMINLMLCHWGFGKGKYVYNI